MNKIYKVIWSKAKHTYVVASEIAKGHTKGETTGKGLKKLAAAMLVAAALLSPSFAWAADTVKVEPAADTASTTAVEVYTKDAANNKFATSDQLQADVAATNAEVAKKANQADLDETNTNLAKKANQVDLEATNANLAKKANQTDLDATNENLAKKADKATTLEGYGITDAYTRDEADVKFATVDQLQADVSATNEELAKKADKATTLAGYGITDAYTKAEVDTADANLQKAIDDEAATRKAEDARLNSEIVKTNTSLNEAASNLSKLNGTVAKGFEDLSTEDKTLQTNIDNEAAARKAEDARLEEKVNKNTSDISGMQSDSKVSEDGSYVRTTNTVGENLTALDTGLQAEVTAREDADNKLQSAIDEEARKRKYSVTNLEKADKQLQTNIDNEAAARKAADTKLVEAVNSGLSLSDDNVLQKNTTAIDDQGNVTTSKTDANEMILNKGKDNQITLNEKGIKVGTNSSVMDKDGVYTGGDTYVAAKAAMSADGKIKGANGAFTVDENGNVASKATITGETVTDGKGASMSNGTVTGKTLTDGIATITNGNINTSGSITGGTVTSMSNISALGDIHAGGAITGASASIQGALTAGSATITGDLTAGGAIQGKSISDGTATMQNGNLTGVKNLSAETITTSGDATIGGDLTVKGKLNVDEIDLTKSGIVGDNNVTASTKVAAGEITSSKTAESTKDGSIKKSAIDYDENGTSTWAQATDADGNWNKSTLTVEGSDVTSKVVDSEKNSNLSTQTSTQSQSTLTDKDNNTNVSTQTVSESSSVVSGKDGEKTYKSYITQNMKKILQKIEDGDGNVLTSTEQTETDITNTAKNGTIANEAKDITNHATENMTNTVGGKLLNDVTGDMENKVGRNLTTTVSGTSTETVTGKKTENYNGGLETTVTGEEKHTVNGSQTNSITGDQVNTIGGKQTTTVTGDVTEDYKANLSTTVGGSQTTTVTGDSSLTAENINNTAKNKITNKAIDVETDAASSIVSKVSNDAGSNTSTQLSYETKEEMSANGKTASYLRGAAEEKSQLTDGAKKTTIDTVAGQTNTNITEGKNVSNSLQKADQIASSVTDGTNTTVVNQNAGSLASSITDGTKANNTSSTVDASVQRIQTDDTHYSVSSKSASKMEDALFNSSTVIDSLKDAEKGLVSTAVTDGATITGISQNAKDINLSAAGGTIASGAKNISNTAAEKLSNSAADIENKASKSILNQVGKNTSWKMTDGTVVESVKDASGKTNQTTTTAADTYQFVKNGDNTLAKRTSSTNDNLNITDGNNTYTKITTATGNKQTVTYGMETASTNLTKSASNTLIENGTQSVLDHMAADTSYTVMNENGNGSRQQQTASEILDRVTDGKNTSEVKQTASEVAASAKDISNTATDKIISQIGDGSKVKSEMTANGITNTAKGKAITNEAKTLLNKASESITDKVGDNVERTMTTDQIQDKVGKTTVTTIDGKTKLTNEDGTHRTEMDFADVLKDLGVRGNATVDGNTTLGTDRNDTLTVNSTSTFKEKVTMENDLNVKSEVLVNEGDKNQVRINKNGITVGLNSTVVDYEGVYVGGDTFEAAKAGMDKDGKLKAANGNFQVDTKGNVSAVSYTVKDTNIKIDNTGINAGGTKVTGLAPADISHAGSTDAVSGGQLYETNTRVSGLETRMGTVETRVDKLDNKIDKVGANAAAMANLHPLEFDEDSKWNVAAAVGSSGSETASAVGVFYRPNENVMVNASAAMGTGENMFGGGVSLRLGHGGNKAKEAQMKAAAAENKELRAKVDDLTARMDALLSVLNPNMSKDFPDVPENHWAYEAVSRLAGNGIVEGYEDGKYHGERQMTRYEMAEIIYNALSKGAKAEKKLVEEFRPELQAMAAQKKA